MKRICGIALALALLLALVPMSAAPVTAAEKEYIVLAGSDFQTSNFSTQKVQKVLDTLAIHGINKADNVFFCGDYTPNQEETQTSGYGITALKNLFTPIVGNKMIFVQGNHDHKDTAGLSPAGDNDPAHGGYGAFVIKEDTYREWGNDRQDTINVANDLRNYLEKKYRAGWKKPVFVLCHIPLHWSNRTQRDGSGKDADVLFDVLEEYGNKGMNLFYLYGHNHSGGYDDFMGGGAVYLKKGDVIEVSHGDKWQHKPRTLSFTYMNAGFIGYYSSSTPDMDKALTMSVFRIKGNEVIVTRYDGDFSFNDGRMGIHNLKSKGAFCQEFYDKYNFHAEVNTLVYPSSRKVTGTDDVAVETPIPAETTTTTVTTTTTTTTTTVGHGVAVSKTVTSKAPGTTKAATVTTKPTNRTSGSGTTSGTVSQTPEDTTTSVQETVSSSDSLSTSGTGVIQPTQDQGTTVTSQTAAKQSGPSIWMIVAIIGTSALAAVITVVLGVVIKKKRE